MEIIAITKGDRKDCACLKEFHASGLMIEATL